MHDKKTHTFQLFGSITPIFLSSTNHKLRLTRIIVTYIYQYNQSVFLFKADIFGVYLLDRLYCVSVQYTDATKFELLYCFITILNIVFWWWNWLCFQNANELFGRGNYKQRLTNNLKGFFQCNINSFRFTKIIVFPYFLQSHGK